MAKLPLIAYEPLVESGSLYGRKFVDDITDNHDNYTHIVMAVGGFDSASFSLGGTADYLKDWYDDGLSRRIVAYNPEGVPIWEGFVNRLNLSAGTLKKTKSVEGMYNRVYMRYNPLITSVSPPLEKSPVTLVLSDDESQDKWGVKSVVIPGGGRTDTTAFNWGRTVLRERKEPNTGEDVSTSAGGGYSLDVECLGYYHTLKWIPYTSTVGGSIQAHQVIQDILRYYNTVNGGWISQDFGLMDYSFALARRGYSDLPDCWSVIESIINAGGAGGERWVGGIYQNRQMIFKAAEAIDGLYSDEYQLYRSLSDQGQFVYDVATGTEIKPWDMTPDKVLHTIDVNVGGTRDLMYIEQVRFSEPYSLELVGGDDQRLAIFLSQRGLPGL